MDPSQDNPSSIEGGVSFDGLPPLERGSTLGTEWWLAMGHLRSKKQEFFLSLVTILAIVGVTAGVALLNCVLGVMAGFEMDLRDKILGANAHIVVLKYGGGILEADEVVDRVLDQKGVADAAPFVYSEMMVRSPFASTGIILKGLDPEGSGMVTSLREDLNMGYEGVLETPEQQEAVYRSMKGEFGPKQALKLNTLDVADLQFPGIIIGTELQEQLQVQVGDKVQVINPMGGGPGPMGMPTPSVRAFRIAAIFHSGMYEYDTKWTYVANKVAAEFLGLGDSVTGIEVKVDDPSRVELVTASIDEALGYPYYGRHWKSLNQKLFEALKLEKVVMGLILSMIVINAGLMIVTMLIMLVLTKGREIAILKAMGASGGLIRRVFVIEGSVVGFLGSVVGTLLGWIGCLGLQQYEYPLETDVYYLSTLPVLLDPMNFLVVGVSAFLVCFVATLYPAAKAAALNPVEALRYQ